MAMGLNHVKFSEHKNNLTVKLLRLQFLNHNKVFAIGHTLREHYK
jgi:hypothetical protein